jgi:hypothetical protein
MAMKGTAGSQHRIRLTEPAPLIIFIIDTTSKSLLKFSMNYFFNSLAIPYIYKNIIHASHTCIMHASYAHHVYASCICVIHASYVHHTYVMLHHASCMPRTHITYMHHVYVSYMHHTCIVHTSCYIMHTYMPHTRITYMHHACLVRASHPCIMHALYAHHIHASCMNHMCITYMHHVYTSYMHHMCIVHTLCRIICTQSESGPRVRRLALQKGFDSRFDPTRVRDGV